MIWESLRNRWSANCAARSVIEKCGDGKGPTGEHGDTERDVSRVDEALLESKEGDRGVSKEKLSSNMVKASSVRPSSLVEIS